MFFHSYRFKVIVNPSIPRLPPTILRRHRGRKETKEHFQEILERKTAILERKMKLSEHFTLEEMTKSATAQAMGIDNKPNAAQVESLRTLCCNVLEPARVKLGKPIRISSGFRCEALNKAVKGAKYSQHKTGEAADLQVSPVSELRRLFDILRTLPIDQLLFEYSGQTRWIHVSHKKGRKQRGYINDNYKA